MVFRNVDSATVKRKKQEQKASSSKTTSTAKDPSSDPLSIILYDAVFPSSAYNNVSSLNKAREFDRAQTLLKALLEYPVPKSMAQHWTAESVPMLLNIYERLSFVHDTCRIYDRDGPLIWAAHLFTRTYVTNMRFPTSKHNESFNETRQELGTYMGKALTSISKALKEPDGAFRDDVLATVWILANYEVCAGLMLSSRAANMHAGRLSKMLTEA